MIIFGTPTENIDWIIGDDEDDLISGLGGDDFIVGNGGADRLLGNDGDDAFVPGLGKDQVWGGFRAYDSGNDTVNYSGYAGAVFVDLALGYGYLQSLGNNDRDTLHGIENAVGSAYDDELRGDGGANVLSGRAGNDGLFGGGGNDRLFGGDGNDNLHGDAGSDDLRGDAGDDLIFGGAGIDSLQGGEGDDALIAGAGADDIDGGAGNDTVYYGTSTSRVAVNLTTGQGLYGEAAGDSIVNVENVVGSGYDDVLIGDAKTNWLIGDDGNDKLAGRGGDDLLSGGAGKDTLTGGMGADSFVFGWVGDSGPTAATRDVITDFSSTQGDKVHLAYLDADETLAGDQAFTFVGTSGFSNVAGELRYGQNGGHAVIEGDTDGDGLADFSMTLTGSHSLTADDFVL
ncbi:MAG: calcium-binding protein [Parvibaculaceae bacterium]